MKIVYLSSGWVSSVQKKEYEKVSTFLKEQSNLIVFDPKDGNMFKSTKNCDDMSIIFKNNCFAINNADIVITIGDYDDTMIFWENGYAYAKKKPIVYYCESPKDDFHNMMLNKTGKIAKNINELETLLNEQSTYEYKEFHSGKGDAK